MGGILYGAGTLYGGVELYGRLNADFDAAQAAQVRTTGLKVKVQDAHLNDWTEHAGQGIPFTGLAVPGVLSTSMDYYMWRLKMDMVLLDNGTIVRVRVGDGTAGDRNIYKQEITSPTVASQWTSWTLAYSGAYYGVAVEKVTASTYNIYGSKSDGIYTNGSLTRSIAGVIDINRVQGQLGAMYVIKLGTDSLDGRRFMDIAYTPNVASSAFVDDTLNYRYLNMDMNALLLSDGRVARVQVGPFYSDPRATALAESMFICFTPSYSSNAIAEPPRLIRGFAGQNGSNSIRQPYLTKLADGYYYLFYTEWRSDADKENAIGAYTTAFWQRSKDLLYWSEPVAVGFDNMAPTNFAVAQTGGWVYLANNGGVFSRPTVVTEYDLTNYVTATTMEIAKDLEEGSATINIANPEGIHDYLQDFGDRPLTIEAGVRDATGTYQYAHFGEWWIDKVQQELNGKINRLTLTAYDISRRMANPLRDVYSFPGQIQFNDWYAGRRNKLFNYYISGGKATFRTVDAETYYYVYRVQRSQFTLYTGWKGHNFDFTVRFRGGSMASKKWGIVYRYKDAKNYYWAVLEGGTLYLKRVRDGTSTNLASSGPGTLTNPTLRVVTRFGYHYIYVNGGLSITHNESVPSVYPGYVGVRFYSTTATTFGCDLFSFTSWETPYTTDSLVKTALSMADLHDYVVSAGEANQVAVVWGPQTDLASPAAALSSLLEQHKLQITWRNGTIEVGQFKENTVVRTIENDAISFELSESSGRRINLSVVDGQEDSYIAIDGLDSRTRGRQIIAYFDVPELKTTEEVVERAEEEVRKGAVATEWIGSTRTYFDLWKMDVVSWVHNGVARSLRIEAFTVQIKQGHSPQQLSEYTMSPIS